MKTECEKTSMCCGAPEHSEAQGFCAACGDGTGFECVAHIDGDPRGECELVGEVVATS